MGAGTKSELVSAVRRVGGYFLPRPHEEVLNKTSDAFQRTKEEVLKHMAREVEVMASLTFEQFQEAQKRGFKP